MAVTMPKIDITFVQKATSLISRSERGIAILIVKDDTDKTFTCRQYTDLTAAQEDAESYTADNFAAISNAGVYTVSKTYVFRMDTEGTLAVALDEISRTVEKQAGLPLQT